MSFEEEDEAVNTLDVEYFCLHTHPARLDFEHATWDQFAEDLTSACKSIFPQHIPQYSGVHALLLNWAEDDLGTMQEIRELDALFREQFNFSTEIWQIPSRQSENRLEMKIGEVKSSFGGDGQLLIVYYGGHGKFDRSGRSIWQAWQNRSGKEKSPTLHWDSLQPMLKRCPSDVLILLDCCYAASAARGDVSGTNEVLAACGREVEALGVCDRSFTQNLMRKLRSFGKNQPFTVKELYVRLLKDRKRLVTTPHYAPLSGRDRPSICITPCRPAHAVLDNDISGSMTSLLASQVNSQQPSAVSDSSTSDSASTSATSMSPGSLPPILDGPRVLLALSLSADAAVPDLEQWKHWISTEAPYNIRNISVRFEAAYKSHSTLVLISMPTSVWQCLPDTSAYRFVDFIRSDNLLKDNRGKVTTPDVKEALGTLPGNLGLRHNWAKDQAFLTESRPGRWTIRDDEQLLKARAEGSSWGPIAPAEHRKNGGFGGRGGGYNAQPRVESPSFGDRGGGYNAQPHFAVRFKDKEGGYNAQARAESPGFGGRGGGYNDTVGRESPQPIHHQEISHDYPCAHAEHSEYDGFGGRGGGYNMSPSDQLPSFEGRGGGYNNDIQRLSPRLSPAVETPEHEYYHPNKNSYDYPHPHDQSPGFGGQDGGYNNDIREWRLWR